MVSSGSGGVNAAAINYQLAVNLAGLFFSLSPPYAGRAAHPWLPAIGPRGVAAPPRAVKDLELTAGFRHGVVRTKWKAKLSPDLHQS